MRLWTIQNRSVLNAVEKGVWYSNLGYRNKDIDTDFDLSLRGRFPIYTYAMLDHSYLNIDTLRRVLKDLLHIQRMPRDWNDVLVELEVSEEDIINMKPVDSIDENSGFHYVSDFKDSTTEIIINCLKGESKYGSPKHLEAVLHKIEGSQVVAAHEFTVDAVNDTVTLKTIFKNDAIGAPALSRYITLTTSGEFRIDRHKDSDLSQIKNSFKDINTLVKAHCAAEKASPDMTVYEAINFVKSESAIAIISAFDEYEQKNPSATMYDTKVQDLNI